LASDDGCDAVLIQSQALDSENVNLMRSFLSITNENSFEKLKKTIKGDASYCGLISADMEYNQFDQRRKELLKKYGGALDYETARLHMRQGLDPDVVRGWLECKIEHNQKVGVSIYALDVNEEFVELAFCWKPPAEGGPGEVRESSLHGATVDNADVPDKQALAPGTPIGINAHILGSYKRIKGERFFISVNVSGYIDYYSALGSAGKELTEEEEEMIQTALDNTIDKLQHIINDYATTLNTVNKSFFYPIPGLAAKLAKHAGVPEVKEVENSILSIHNNWSLDYHERLSGLIQQLERLQGELTVARKSIGDS